ncbi:hypothetical protein [Roseibium sp.]
MNIWSFALVALILAGATAGKYANPGFAFEDKSTLSGLPITTLHTPPTP